VTRLWGAFWKSFKAEWQAETLTLHLKSGGRVVIDRVTDWRFKNSGNEIIEISIMQSKRAKVKLLVKTLDLSQIAAVTKR
jgi:hypothetical protein